MHSIILLKLVISIIKYKNNFIEFIKTNLLNLYLVSYSNNRLSSTLKKLLLSKFRVIEEL